MIEFKNIIKEYDVKNGKVRALDDVSLTFDSAGLVLITGENGCGKSTLMNLIGSIDTPTSGSIKIDGEEIDYANFNLFKQTLEMAKRTRNVSFIYQTPNLIESMTLESNLEMARLGGKITIADALARVGLKGKGRRLPSELSIGQMQRACIARAIIRDSDIILADEPTASLDPKMREDIIGYLHELAKDRLVIVITHNESEFYDCSRKIVMDNGKIVQDTTYRSAERKSCGVQRNEKPKWKPLMQSARMKVRKNVFRFSFNLIMLIIFFAGATVLLTINDKTTLKQYRAALKNQDNGYALYVGDKSVLDNLEKTSYTSAVNTSLINYNYATESYDNHITWYKPGATTYYNAMHYDSEQRLQNQLYPMPMSMISEDGIIGRLPAKGDEVVISSYYADCMIFYDNNMHGLKYADYNDILAKGYLYAEEYNNLLPVEQARPLKIVGIKKENTSCYDELKSVRRIKPHSEELIANEMNIKIWQLEEKVNTEYRSIYTHANYNDAMYNYYAERNNPLLNGKYAVKTQKLISENIKVYGKIDDGCVVVGMSKLMPRREYNALIGGAAGEEREKILSDFQTNMKPFNYRPEKKEKSFDGKTLAVDLGLEYSISGFYDDYATDGNGKAIPFGVAMPQDIYQDVLRACAAPTDYITARIPLNGKHNINGVMELVRNKNSDHRGVGDNTEYSVKFVGYGVVGAIESSTELIGFFIGIAVGCLLICIILFLIFSVVNWFKRYSDEIGVLMSLGTKLRHIIGFITAEFLLTLLIGLSVGVALGIIAAWVFNHVIFCGLISFTLLLIGWETVLIIIGITAFLIIMPIIYALIGVSIKSPVRQMRKKA